MKHLNINSGVMILCYFTTCYSQPTYKAAVIAYAPIRELHQLPREVVEENAKKYVQIIEEVASQGANITIFPECGLTTLEINMKVMDHLESYSVEIPKIEESEPPNPCNAIPDNYSYHKVLTAISCAAKMRNIYVVINVLEKEHVQNNSPTLNYFSTNLVFDALGFIINKYRKINLHKDQHFSRGYEKSKPFKTDFGVFGMLISEDILYRNPAIELSDDMMVTNIIYSSAWNSEAPFLNGLSIQDGYAKESNINLLAACLNDPFNNRSGSGIFLADGSMFSTYETKPLIQEIPVTKEKITASKCREYKENYNNVKENTTKNPDNFITSTSIENMQNYTFRRLDIENHQEIKVCGKNNFCCLFTITIDTSSNADSNYTYQLVSFFGSRIFGSETIAVSVCAVVACLNENRTSCGVRGGSFPKTKFGSIQINAKYSNKKIYVQPITLKYNFHPATAYRYCKTINSTIGETNVNISTTASQESLLAFGFFGRMYDFDNKTAGELDYKFDQSKDAAENNEENSTLIITIVFIILMIIIVMIVVVAVIVWLLRRKRCKGNPCCCKQDTEEEFGFGTNEFYELMPSRQITY